MTPSGISGGSEGDNLQRAGCKQCFKSIDIVRLGERRMGLRVLRQVRKPGESMSLAKGNFGDKFSKILRHKMDLPGDKSNGLYGFCT